MSTSLEKKREAVAAFGIPVDPEDVDYTNFLFQRRHLATVPDGNGRELAYVAELDELEHAIIMGLDRIRARDGEKIFREAAGYLREAVDIVVSERPQARSGTHAAHV